MQNCCVSLCSSSSSGGGGGGGGGGGVLPLTPIVLIMLLGLRFP